MWQRTHAAIVVISVLFFSTYGQHSDPWANCKLHQTVYVPSTVEEAWLTNAAVWDSMPGYCNQVAKFVNSTSQWLEIVQRIMLGMDVSNAAQAAVFSKFVHHLQCDHWVSNTTITKETRHRVVESWIEPLFGGLRHPGAFCPNEVVGRPHEGSRTYILLGSSRLPTFYKGPHVNFYFDLGASTYSEGMGGSSQRWFIDAYARR
jgi:hypothetical protein